jgi:peptidoglycan/xylan/chitin deacetylase (PgdA/CDA1 family)
VGYSTSTFILTYHKIAAYSGEGSRSPFVSPGLFERQLEYLHARGYRAIPLSRLVGVISGGREIPGKAFVITFDDGYESVYADALPILKRFDWPATVFLSSGFIGRTHAYPGQPPEKHLGEEQIRAMRSHVEFGSHTVSHARIDTMTVDGLTRELAGSREAIGGITGSPVNLFCYPYGIRTNGLLSRGDFISLVKRTGYIAACTTDTGLVRASTPLLELPRCEFKEARSMSAGDCIRNSDVYVKTFLRL